MHPPSDPVVVQQCPRSPSTAEIGHPFAAALVVDVPRPHAVDRRRYFPIRRAFVVSFHKVVLLFAQQPVVVLGLESIEGILFFFFVFNFQKYF